MLSCMFTVLLPGPQEKWCLNSFFVLKHLSNVGGLFLFLKRQAGIFIFLPFKQVTEVKCSEAFLQKLCAVQQ